MALSQRLEIRQGQTLVMTPQLQQAIKLLQLSNVELADYCEQELEKNPLLERDDSATFELLQRNCLACGDRAPCEADLRGDPANPVWQRYCPNAAKLTALAVSERARR